MDSGNRGYQPIVVTVTHDIWTANGLILLELSQVYTSSVRIWIHTEMPRKVTIATMWLPVRFQSMWRVLRCLCLTAGSRVSIRVSDCSYVVQFAAKKIKNWQANKIIQLSLCDKTAVSNSMFVYTWNQDTSLIRRYTVFWLYTIIYIPRVDSGNNVTSISYMLYMLCLTDHV